MGEDSLSQPEWGRLWLWERSENQTVLSLRLYKRYEGTMKKIWRLC